VMDHFQKLIYKAHTIDKLYLPFREYLVKIVISKLTLLSVNI